VPADGAGLDTTAAAVVSLAGCGTPITVKAELGVAVDREVGGPAYLAKLVTACRAPRGTNSYRVKG
jgi:hypothetical protein